jgi:hypothetical protein
LGGKELRRGVEKIGIRVLVIGVEKWDKVVL